MEGLVPGSSWEAAPDLAEVLVENSLGFHQVPLGVATGFVIDGVEVDIPLAVEEPSVIAAASFMAWVIGRNGGFETHAARPLIAAHVYLEDVPDTWPRRVQDGRAGLLAEIGVALDPMTRRGGGFRDLSFREFADAPGTIRCEIILDVRDAMGANIANTVAERASRYLESILGARRLMAILTNDSSRRLARASFRLPVDALARAGIPGSRMAERIVRGARIAELDPERAVTHNKGIMNGVSALALATGNDTRGLEAAVHAFAARSGSYRPVSSFRLDDQGACLEGSIELPLPLGTLGGAVGALPTSEIALAILGRPSAAELSRYAAALGLAQNTAALAALVGEGIQSGHMRLHAGRLAYRAGARGAEIPAVVDRLVVAGRFSDDTARAVLAELRGAPPA